MLILLRTIQGRPGSHQMPSIRCDTCLHCHFLKRIAKLAVTLSTYSGFGALLGPPICGWLITSHGFKSAQIFSGVMLAVGTGLLVSSISYFNRCRVVLLMFTGFLDIDHRPSPEAISQHPAEN
jgi:hypothetical protein